MESQEIHWPGLFVAVLLGAGCLLEWAWRSPEFWIKLPMTLQMVTAHYDTVRTYALTHPWMSMVAVVIGLTTLALLYRGVVMLWSNVIVASLSGVRLQTRLTGFRHRPFELLPAIHNAPQGQTWIGMDPKGRPVYLSESDLDTHGHIMGHTGSGKTKSVLEPLMLQDMMHGKGVLFMDAKGSSENVDMLQGLAQEAKRASDVRVFALAYPEWSHTYNPVYLSAKSDPLAVAERIFSIFEMENEYYRGQSKLFFYQLVRLLAGTGKPFNMVDIRLCVCDDDVLGYAFELSDDIRAKYEIERQGKQLGKRRAETFTGLTNALADYDHPLLGSYNPDIVLDDLVEQKGIVYFNLPANRYALLAPAIGKIVLQHVQAIGASRQIDRKRHDQTPFSINIDELNRFAFPELVPSLAMLRDAHMQFRLAHQSIGDLEQVSPEFSRQVQDNTRWKVMLYENDPDHLEKIARSYGTKTAFRKTVRFKVGPLFTFLNTGDVSNREVEEFVLHPNLLKCLEARGQGYLLKPEGMTGLNFAMLPRLNATQEHPKSLGPAHDIGLDFHGRFVLNSQNYLKNEKRERVSIHAT